MSVFNVTAACLMLLQRVKCYCSVFNVTPACLMLLQVEEDWFERGEDDILADVEKMKGNQLHKPLRRMSNENLCKSVCC